MGRRKWLNLLKMVEVQAEILMSDPLRSFFSRGFYIFYVLSVCYAAISGRT